MDADFHLLPGSSTDTIIWSCVEPAAGVVSACLPCLRGLLTREVFQGLFARVTPWKYNNSDVGAIKLPSEPRLDTRQERNKRFPRLGGDSVLDGDSVIELAPPSRAVLQTTCEGEDDMSIMGPEDGGQMPGNVIDVKTDLEMVF